MDREARLRIPVSKKMLVQSAYSAMEGDGIGALTVLYKFERLAEASGIPAAINRAAEMLLEPARQGMIPTRRPERLPHFVIKVRCKAPAAAQDQNFGQVAFAQLPKLSTKVSPLGVGTVSCCRADWAVATENKEMMKAAMVILNRRMKHDRTDIKSRDS